ncbi:MAG TPA: response regulator [Verrucomicrobiae bacterium]|nr:response regulator [Verrucomicrobiae bacterium]
MARIMLVDDSPIVVAVLTDFLRKEGHDVEAVTTPFGVTNRVAECRPDVLLMDLGLPGLNGETLLRLVQRAQPEVRKIVVSSAGEGTMKRLLQDGLADDYFMKGSDLQNLSGKIDRLLRDRSAREFSRTACA